MPRDRTITQIYEVQTPAEAEALIELDVDHIGSVILSTAQWRIPLLKETIRLTAGSRSKSSLIPLFSGLEDICRALDYYGPEIVHFCEDVTRSEEIARACDALIVVQESVKERFPEIEIMRSIPIATPGKSDRVATLELARKFEAASDFFLTDTLVLNDSDSTRERQPVEGFVGITGKVCDWEMAARLVETTHIPVILAGGLSPDNVFEAMMHVQPTGVDSCTGTNARDADGSAIRFKKNYDKVNQFVKETRRAGQIIEPLNSSGRG